METTDRAAVRAIVVVRRIDAAIVAQVQAVRVAIVRRSRPIVAAASDIGQTAVAEAATTRSWVPDGRGRAELAGKVHAFVGTIVGMAKR